MDGRNHTERDSEHRGDGQGGEAKTERIGKTALEVVQDRCPLAQRFAEIEPGQLLDVSKVLDMNGIVEAILLVDALQHFRALGWRHVRPDEERAGVTGRGLHREEDQRDRAEDSWHREEQALDNVLLHGLHLVQRRGRKWFRPEGAATPVSMVTAQLVRSATLACLWGPVNNCGSPGSLVKWPDVAPAISAPRGDCEQRGRRSRR